jgi:polysaccharide biosynthesis transport protein
VETTRALYESLLQKSKESDILTAMKTSNIQVVDPARPPKAPYRPNLPLNLSFGLLSGFLLGVGIILVPEQGQRVRDPGDAEFFLSLPELGVIPSGNQKSDQARRLPSFSGSRSLPVIKGGRGNEMTILQNRASPFADSFHDTLISILHARKNGVAPQVIAVSSANPCEGKTTVVSNLAIALAELNKRVLLVDGDTRKPRLHTIFQIDKTPGVSEVLSGQSTPVLRETKVPNLVVLPAGAGVDPRALFGPRLGDLFTHLRERFDLILVDTPSILNLPDARMFALESDAVILVIRAGLGTRDTIQFACRRLQEGGSWLLGAILNDWNPRSSGHRYGYGYGEYYREAKQERHI